MATLDDGSTTALAVAAIVALISVGVLAWGIALVATFSGWLNEEEGDDDGPDDDIPGAPA